MVESFEEVGQTDNQESTQESDDVASALRPLAIAAGLVYISIVVFSPFILLGQPFYGTLPLFFSVLFFVATLVFVAGWFVWTLLNRRVNPGVSYLQLLWPLAAIPISIGFFYLFFWVIRLFT